MNFDTFTRQLSQRISGELPGIEAQLRMAPPKRLSVEEYMRMKDLNPKHSAVLVCLYPNLDSLYTVMMLRPEELGFHGKQVSFPGGSFEEADHTLEQTALREAAEEIGIPEESVQVIGRLTPVYIPVSNYLVQPVLGLALSRPDFLLNRKEVHSLVESDCRSLFAPGQKGSFIFQTNMGEDIAAPYYESGSHKIWGATAMILSELEALLQDIFL